MINTLLASVLSLALLPPPSATGTPQLNKHKSEVRTRRAGRVEEVEHNVLTPSKLIYPGCNLILPVLDMYEFVRFWKGKLRSYC